MFSLDICGVLDDRSGKDGECFPDGVIALLLEFEGGFLGHGSVEDVVAHEEGCVHRDLGREGVFVFGYGGSNHVDHGVTVGEWTVGSAGD